MAEDRNEEHKKTDSASELKGRTNEHRRKQPSPGLETGETAQPAPNRPKLDEPGVDTAMQASPDTHSPEIDPLSEQEPLGMAMEQGSQAELAGDEPVEGPRFTTSDQVEADQGRGAWKNWEAMAPINEGSFWLRVAKWGAFAAAVSTATYLVARRRRG